MRTFLIFLCFLFALQWSAHGQTQLELFRTGPTPPGYMTLLESKENLRAQDSLNEVALNLVEVYLTDSTFKRKKQRHKAAGFGIGSPLLAIRWQALYNRKEKFIGTANSRLRVPSKPLFTEYDVNWNLDPHLREYMDLAYYGYAEQKSIGRYPKDRNNYEGAPYEYPEFGDNMKPYHLHCENTPPEQFRPVISEFLYPCLRDKDKPQFDYFGEDLPSIGLYGVFCLDCNHSCHPEIHPYEWIWWMNLNPAADSRPNLRTWFMVLVREGSNRMKKWSPGPRSGKTSIPFVFPADKALNIRLNHLAYSEFSEEGFATLEKVPVEASSFKEVNYNYTLTLDTGFDAIINLETNKPVNTEALKFAISHLNFDPKTEMVSGNLEVWTSVEWLYSMQVEFDF